MVAVAVAGAEWAIQGVLWSAFGGGSMKPLSVVVFLRQAGGASVVWWWWFGRVVEDSEVRRGEVGRTIERD